MAGKKKPVKPEQLELLPKPQDTEPKPEPKPTPVKTRIQMTNKFIIR